MKQIEKQLSGQYIRGYCTTIIENVKDEPKGSKEIYEVGQNLINALNKNLTYWDLNNPDMLWWYDRLNSELYEFKNNLEQYRYLTKRRFKDDPIWYNSNLINRSKNILELVIKFC